ncbi:MAG: hypothetical protein NVSMB65_18360 [Chloroflexota bacterium]
MSSDIQKHDDWTVLRIDPASGELLGTEEAAFRERIRVEAEQGLVGVDALYLSVHRTIHQPLVGEQGRVLGDAWLLQRANRTTLRIPIGEDADATARENVAVTIARAAIDDFAAEVMMHLFAAANDPPNWRRPSFTVRLSDLLDRLGFRRDDRGIHRSDARRRLTTTLLALHLTHIGMQREAGRRGGRSVGFIAPLLAAVGYATREDVGHLSPIEVFEQGLPEEVSIAINQLWYAGVRQPDGLPGQDYTLIPRPLPGAGGRKRGGSRSRVAAVLREYVLRCRAATTDSRVAITRRALLDISSISDRNVTQASRTLTHALDILCTEETLVAYAPSPVPLGSGDMITLYWQPERQAAPPTPDAHTHEIS